MEFNGWEKIGEALGKGGQSVVHLARTPERAEERRKAGASLQDLANAAKQKEYADALYAYSRPDRPNEQGALKEFHERFGSAPPIERLRREVAILREGRPGLPRLLDSNVDGLWMVTEYFKNGTLARQDNRGKFKGEALEALRAFRGLVETVARLHAEKIVHRDIKPANVFVSDDGEWILGDFGLVQGPEFQGPPLTRLGETVGPWEHLPWWAKADAIEGPSPPTTEIDVFLLGNLLWCMVSGASKFEHGDKFREPAFNLEKKFSSGQYMQLINLVLSQSLGERPEFCVKDARVLLHVVEEVLDAITERIPITDENDVLVIPCHFCNGFYERMELNPSEQARMVVQRVNDGGVQMSPSFVNVLQCGICKNIQMFEQGQPFEAFKVKRISRINPQKPKPKKSPLWW